MILSDKQYYKIDFKKLALLLLPTFLRKSRLAAFISLLITPVKRMYNAFRDQQRQDWYRLNHNSQVFSLKNVLNDAFDCDHRRIDIIDAKGTERVYIHTPVENKPLYIGQNEAVYIYTQAEYDNDFDFEVVIPLGLEYDVYKLRALINEYKLVTKKYLIKHV